MATDLERIIRYGSIVSGWQKEELKFRVFIIFLVVWKWTMCAMNAMYVGLWVYTNTHETHARLHACMQVPAMHPLKNSKKVLPMLSHFLFPIFQPFSANCWPKRACYCCICWVFLYKHRYKRSFSMCAAHSLLLLTIICLGIATSQKSKIIYYDLGGSVFFVFSVSFHCEILSLFIAAVDLLYNQRKDKILWKQSTPRHHPMKATQNKRNKQSVEEGWKQTAYAQNFNVFIMSSSVCCVVSCHLYTQKRQTNK